MSRIGNRKLVIPSGVTVENKDNMIKVTGPKGSLELELKKGLNVTVEGEELTITRENEQLKAMHGTTNANIHNMIVGVSKGYEKGLEIIGVGYRFALKGNKLVINAGYSHPVELEIPNGLTVEANGNTEITIKGIDKALVGEFAANVRKVREPEPYKGKGIRYKDEYIRRKEGKKAA